MERERESRVCRELIEDDHLMIRGRKVSRGSMDREIIDGEERIVHGREWCRICVVCIQFESQCGRGGESVPPSQNVCKFIEHAEISPGRRLRWP
ncbi:hypothetical protein COLO4_28337 [Corchorus olitorius]|uniref:Uncharacterized protein n=1 Tax=Corchorus olitorius TaxID=93759 RepID=A0A1R3HLT1_9ROSI|nr:hypothetical protein COLO4_28337 [Corchorus olitorius]